MKPSRAERLRSAGLDAPMSAEEIKRIALERQLARFGRVVNPELQELETAKRTPPIGKAPPAAVLVRSDADVDEISLVVPMPPTLTNSGAGRSRQWWSIHREKKAYWRRLDELQLVGLIPKPQRRIIERGTVRSVMTLGGGMDDDNAMARHKWVMDWLATRGYVRNDKLIKWEAMPVQVVKRDAEYTIALTITRSAEL